MLSWIIVVDDLGFQEIPNNTNNQDQDTYLCCQQAVRYHRYLGIRSIQRVTFIASEQQLVFCLAEMASRTIKLINIGSLIACTAIQFTPTPVFCLDDKGKKGQDDKEDFNKWFKGQAGGNIKGQDSAFTNIERILAGQLNDGSLSPLKNFMESGMAGQLGYGFLMGYSSGYCIKKVNHFTILSPQGSYLLIPYQILLLGV